MMESLMPTTSAERTTLESDLALFEDVLCRELDHYRDLLDLMLKEKDLLVSNQPEELAAVLELQHQAMERAREMEAARMEALGRLATRLGVTEPVTLRALESALTGDPRARVARLREALTHVIPRVDQVNRINVMLIRNSLSYIATTMHAILDESGSRSATYAPGGAVRPRQVGPGWMDRKA